MSETCGGCVYDGRPLDGVAVEIGADGRVRIGGPVVFAGYDGEPELTAAACGTAGSSPRTSAARRRRAARVTGRVDDVVISGGVNVPAAGGRRAGSATHPDVRRGRGGRRARRRSGASGSSRWSSATSALDDAARLGRPPSTRARGRRVESCSSTALPLLPNGKVDRLAAARRWRRRWPEPRVFSIPMRTRFRGITVREGMLLRGRRGVGRVQPVPGVRRRRGRRALAGRCAGRRPTIGWPDPLRDRCRST